MHAAATTMASSDFFLNYGARDANNSPIPAGRVHMDSTMRRSSPCQQAQCSHVVAAKSSRRLSLLWKRLKEPTRNPQAKASCAPPGQRNPQAPSRLGKRSPRLKSASRSHIANVADDPKCARFPRRNQPPPAGNEDTCDEHDSGADTYRTTCGGNRAQPVLGCHQCLKQAAAKGANLGTPQNPRDGCTLQ